MAEVRQIFVGKSKLLCTYNRLGTDNHDWLWNFTAKIHSVDNKHLEYIPFGAQIHCVLDTENVDFTVPVKDVDIKKEISVSWKQPLVYFQDAFCEANQASNPLNYGPAFKVLFECNTRSLPVTIRSAIEEIESIECDGIPELVH